MIPRVLNYWAPGDYTAALGIGKLITSVTMTLFYLLMEYARRERYKINGEKPLMISVWVLSVIRIALCCFPQNEWTSAEPSLLWGILRNIPFAAIGVMTVMLWFKSAKDDKPLKFAWLAVTLSFAFYLPVVLWSQMLPNQNKGYHSYIQNKQQYLTQPDNFQSGCVFFYLLLQVFSKRHFSHRYFDRFFE